MSESPSLLPLINDGGGIVHLEIGAAPKKQAFLGDSLRTFRPDYCDDPLACGFNAKLCTDGGSVIVSLMLLIQRDEYPGSIHPTMHITNATLDACWQRAFESEYRVDEPSGGLFFSAQFDLEKRFVPFAPLFFCSRRSIYFHPLCSRCGSMLELCRDDEMLKDNGLPLYSQSLQRFLHCSTCTPLHGEPWYSKEVPTGLNIRVRDCFQLVNDFGRIQFEEPASHQFPCPACPQRDDCYGTQQKALQVLSILSFYPFYMLTSEGFQMSGREYLAYVSGASTEDLSVDAARKGLTRPARPIEESSYADTPDAFFFPEGDERRFLETLYLKLRFLRAAIERVTWRQPLEKATACYRSPASFGVALPLFASLPSYWSFQLTFPGVSSYLDGLPGFPETLSGKYSYGLLWFVALLSNADLGEETIIGKLNTLLGSDLDSKVKLREIDEIFQPSQIFWVADKEVDYSPWLEQWDQVMSSGWSLLQEGMQSSRWKPSQINAVLDTCLREVLSRMLPLSQPKAADPELVKADRNILQILEQISEKWQKSTTVTEHFDPFFTEAPEESERIAAPVDGDPEKTVIIPTGTAENNSPQTFTSALSTPSIEAAEKDDPDETVIISEANNQDQNEHGKSPLQPSLFDAIDTPADPDEDLVETIPLGTAAAGDGPGSNGPAKPATAENFLEETVNLKKNDDQLQKQGREINEDDKKKKAALPKAIEQLKSSDPDDDDFLTETVVLKPDDNLDKP